MSDTISLHELKKNQRRVIARVKRGEVLTITSHGHPVALLQPATPKQAPGWDELMKDVYAAAKAPGPAHPNPVLAERARRRR